MKLSPKEQERLDYMCFLAKQSRAVWWAEKEFGWRPLVVEGKDGEKKEAWYQYLLLASCDDIFVYPEDHEDEDMRGKPIRKFAWRIGRQCLPKGSLVHTRDGKIISIQDSPDAWKIGIKSVVQISVNNGSKLKCTPEHKFFTAEGAVEVQNLKPGDKIRSLVAWNKFGNGEIPYQYKQYVNKWRTDTISGTFIMNDEIAELVGWITSDSCIGNKKQSVKFTNTNFNYCKKVEYFVNKYFPDITVTWYEKGNVDVSEKAYVYNKRTKIVYDLLFTTKSDKGRKNSIKDLIRIMNYDGCGFPQNINYFTKSQLCAFFRGMYAADGSIVKRAKNAVNVNLCCGLEKKYAEYCREYLNKLGISCAIHEQLGELSTAVQYKVYFGSRENNFAFQNTIGEILEKPNVVINEDDLTLSEYFEDVDGELYKYSTITAIEPYGEEEVWNIEYPNKGRYFSGGLLHKNSGKTEIISLTALYLALNKPIHYTKRQRYKDVNLIGTTRPDGTINDTGWTEKQIPFTRGAKIIIASADADKARTVFDRVIKFLNESPKFQLALDAGTIEKKMTPFPELTFHIPGWTEPAWITFRGPGAGGQTARSKTFDYKLYDEADYMPSVFFEAEAATSINAGDNGLTILSSTPTGKRGYFFNACFVKNTPVTMADKTFKFIQDIKIGDEVMNRWGQKEKVTNTMMTIFEGPVVSIKTTKDNKVITATANHRFISVKKKDRICKACDAVSFGPKEYCPLYGNHEHLGKLNIEYNSLQDLGLGDFLAIPKSLITKNGYRKPGGIARDKFYFVPISEYVMQKVKTEVYNLTVGIDHSYCVNNYAVANCTDKKLNFQEFHVPSRENPRYTKAFDKGFRATLPMTTYQHEIEADWGTVEEGVFDWTYFEWVFRPHDKRPDPKDPLNELKTPIYRKFDTKNGTRAKPFPDEYEKISMSSKDVDKIGYTNIGMWLQKRFPNREDSYNYWFGADFGYQADPTELVVFKEKNGIMKLILRIHLEHVEFMMQCDIIALLDLFYQFQSLGMDEGSNGLMIKQILQGKDGNGFNKYRKHDFLRRLHAVNFSQTVDIVDNFTREAKKAPVKQFMTDMIVMHAQNRQLIMPSVDIDTDLENQFRNHTYSIGANGTIIYSKSTVCPDHCVDAIRTVFWAKSQSKRPVNRQWPVGNVFRSRSAGSWG